MKMNTQYLNRLIFIILVSSCTVNPNQVPSPVPSPTPSHVPSGWAPEFDNWLDDAFDTMPEGAKIQVCPKSQSKDAWRLFWYLIVKAESGFNPRSRYTENLGIDYVTKKQVVSEGYFQLSYQDQRGYPECKVFNWELDKNKSDLDPTKTIFDAKNQFLCAMAIAKKLGAQGRPFGAYWSTARHTSTPGKRIYSELAQKLPSCF
jgi:hypothetical protein